MLLNLPCNSVHYLSFPVDKVVGEIDAFCSAHSSKRSTVWR